MQNHPPYDVLIRDRHQMTSHRGQETMSLTPTPAPPARILTDADFDSEFDEDVDEDFTDEECQMSFDRFVQKKGEHAQQEENTGTVRLLAFLDLVNSDIQKFFGRNKGSDDACDVYQDKWISGKSGRELYYSDLMKIAQGLDTEDPKSPSSSDTVLREKGNGDKTTASPHTGRLHPDLGLGPLEGLFQCGVKTGSKVTNTVGNGKAQQPHLKRPVGVKAHHSAKRAKTMPPMADRKLPPSFWNEPTLQAAGRTSQHAELTFSDGSARHRNNPAVINAGDKCVHPKRFSCQQNGSGLVSLGQNSVPPDFTDLLDCWGDVTHAVASCTPSGQQQSYPFSSGGHHGVPTTAAI